MIALPIPYVDADGPVSELRRAHALPAYERERLWTLLGSLHWRSRNFGERRDAAAQLIVSVAMFTTRPGFRSSVPPLPATTPRSNVGVTEPAAVAVNCNRIRP